MKNGKLKKLITLATVVASTFALVACGSSSSDDSKGSDSSAKKDSGTVYRTLDEIKNALSEAGLIFENSYNAFSFDEPKYDSQRVYIIAREHGKIQEA